MKSKVNILILTMVLGVMAGCAESKEAKPGPPPTTQELLIGHWRQVSVAPKSDGTAATQSGFKDFPYFELTAAADDRPGEITACSETMLSRTSYDLKDNTVSFEYLEFKGKGLNVPEEKKLAGTITKLTDRTLEIDGEVVYEKFTPNVTAEANNPYSVNQQVCKAITYAQKAKAATEAKKTTSKKL